MPNASRGTCSLCSLYSVVLIPLLIPLLVLLLSSGSVMAEVGGRIIVKYRGTTDARMADEITDPGAHLEGLRERTGLTLKAGRRLDARSHVIYARELDTEALASRLRQEPEIEYAVPDRRRRAHAMTNDPLLAQQWYLHATETAAIRASETWSRSSGSPGVVVAVLDTGVRPEHPDLAANLLPGYDFISYADVAGDFGGRDSDATDMGDYVTFAETQNSDIRALCGDDVSAEDSSWHGTRVAGLIAATANNGTGIAGVAWNSRILPVRVLGKCGGYDSDIVAAMLWSAGLSVPGVPVNPHPAKIVNLSLGSASTCDDVYADAIARLTAQGTLVVASSGNGGAGVDAPGNCPGVLAVGGVRHIGTKVGYSSFGPEIGVSAPAGNCVNTSGPCLYSLLTTYNSGAHGPEMNTYTDEYNYNVGTSFSAPLVSGVAALMLAVNSSLTAIEATTIIKNSARPFPRVPELPMCPTQDENGQCNCTTHTCGAGLLDAAAAVAAVPPPVRFRDAVYRWGQVVSGRGDEVFVGVNCDVFQLALDVTSGRTGLAMGYANTLDEALRTHSIYRDTITESGAMFSYALYGPQPVKTFSFLDAAQPGNAAAMGTITAFAYCLSAQPDAHAYIYEKDKCQRRYNDGRTESCATTDNGRPATVATSVTLRDAVYLYGQPIDAAGDTILTGSNCDVFQLMLSIDTGATDIAMGQGGSLAAAKSDEWTYRDRIGQGMFAYTLYDNQIVKAFTFKDAQRPQANQEIARGTVFGYCYASSPNARAYLHRRNACSNLMSDGTSVSVPCL